MKIKKIYLFFLISLLPASASAEFVVSAQGAAVFSSYNDVRLPGDSGTNLSYTEDLDTDPVFSPRIEAGYEFDFPLYAGFMVSLLRLEASGTLEKTVIYDGLTFASGTDVTARFRFDSYRGTVRYYFIKSEKIKAGGGFTGKIRDAEISLESSTQKGGLKNRGFVPLFNFYAEWIVSGVFSLMTYGDAAWSPYGRAEDIFIGGVYRFDENTAIIGGYRLLEGGADNDEVYTFSMFHYAVIGAEVRF